MADLLPIDRYPHAVEAIRTAAAREGDPRRAGRIAEHAVNLLDAEGLLIAAGEPTSERETLAVDAVVDAWPDLAADPVYVEQLVRIVLNAAYNPAWRQPSCGPAEPPADPVTPAVPREDVSGHEGPPVGGIQDIPHEAGWAFEDGQAKCALSHGGPARHCCTKAGVRAARPYLVAPALRSLATRCREAADRHRRKAEMIGFAEPVVDQFEWFAAFVEQHADEIAAGSSSGTGTPPKEQDHG